MAVLRLLGAIFLLVLQARSKMVLGYKEKDYVTACPPSKCGQGGPEIRYPLRLQSSPSYCGSSGLVLLCSGNDTILSLPVAGSLKVISIDYPSALITIKREPWPYCQLQNLRNPRIIPPFNDRNIWNSSTLVNCSKKWDENSRRYKCRMITCLSNADHFVYMADDFMDALDLPSDCAVVSSNLYIPYVNDPEGRTRVDDYVERGELSLDWDDFGIIGERQEYEVAGARCEFNLTTNQAFCRVINHPGEPQYFFSLLLAALGI